MEEATSSRNRARGAKYQSSPQQAANGLSNDIDADHERPRGGCHPVGLTSLKFCLFALHDILAVLLCAVNVVGATVSGPNVVFSLSRNWRQRWEVPMSVTPQKIAVFMAIRRGLCFTIAAFIMTIVRQFCLIIPCYQKLLKCFHDVLSSGFTRQTFTRYRIERSIRSRRSSVVAQMQLRSQVPTLFNSTKSGIDTPRRIQLSVTNGESGLFYPPGCGCTLPALSRLSGPRETMIVQPNNIDKVLSEFLAGSESINLFEQGKIGNSFEYPQATSMDGRSLCHQDAPLLICPNVTTATRWECSIPRRSSRTKRSKHQASFAFAPPRCRAVYSMTGISLGPGGDGDITTAFGSHGLGTPTDGLGSAGGGVPWSEGDTRSQRVHVPGLNNDWPHVPQGGYEPSQNKSTKTPPPPVPLSAGTQCNEHKFGWNAGFVAGCMFATRASGAPAGAPRSQPDPIRPASQLPPVPILVDRHAKEYETEWYAGFVAGCEFASRTSGGPPSGMFQSQFNALEPTRPVLSSTVSPPSTTLAHSPAASSDDAPLIQPEINPRNAITSSLHHETSQKSSAEVANDHCHGELAPSTTQATADVDPTDAVQADVVSVSQGTQFGLSNNSSTSFDTDRTRLSNGDKRHKCDVCNKAFRKRYQLSDHMHRHRGDVKGHPCDFPGCNKSFTNRANMRRHQKTHPHSLTAEGGVKAAL